MANLSHYVTPAIAAVATAASLASATIAQKPPAPRRRLIEPAHSGGKEGRLDSSLRRGSLSTAGTATRSPTRPAPGGRSRRAADRQSRQRHRHTRGALDIITAVQFDEFGLTWEWRIAEGGNSRLKYFVLEDLPSAIGHVQLIDDERHADAKVGPHRQTGRALRRPAGSKSSVEAGRAVQPEPDRFERHDGGALSERHARAQCELDSPALREAIAKSKFKDVARFGKLPNGFILLQDHGDRVWCGTSRSESFPRPLQLRVRKAHRCRRRGGAPRRHHDRRQPFTSYIYPETLKKPVLYPLQDRQRDARDARLPARSQAPRAFRPPASRRPLVQPRRRERAGFLEQLE